LIDLPETLAFVSECGGCTIHTQAPSEIDSMRGAYGEGGRALCSFGCLHIPETLLFLLLEAGVETLGRIRGCGLICAWRLEYEVEVSRIADGGVLGPKVELTVDDDLEFGTVILVSLLFDDFSV